MPVHPVLASKPDELPRREHFEGFRGMTKSALILADLSKEAIRASIIIWCLLTHHSLVIEN